MLFRTFSNRVFFSVFNDVTSWVIRPRKTSRNDKAGNFSSNPNSFLCNPKYGTSIPLITLAVPSVFKKRFPLALKEKEDGISTHGILHVAFPS